MNTVDKDLIPIIGNGVDDLCFSDKKDPNRKQTEEEVKSNIASLIASNSSGVWYHMLPDMYLGFYNLNLPKEYLDCVLDWTDILTHEIM